MVWLIALTSLIGVLFRPKKTPEWIWAVGGAVLILLGGYLSWPESWSAVRQGFDVYFFLIAMMLLSELARSEGLFDGLAGFSVKHAGRSSRRLFLLIYTAGISVTMFLSNDATAVVMTPAVYAVVKRAGARPMPYLFACALIANAASFLLPISNPANLVFFAGHTPGILNWIARFGWASLGSIAMTFIVLFIWFNQDLSLPLKPTETSDPAIPKTGWWTLAGLALVVVVMLTASYLKREFGGPALVAAVLVAAGICVAKREWPKRIIEDMAWGVIPLVAGLFVIVAAINHAGAEAAVAKLLTEIAKLGSSTCAFASAFLVGIASNLFNNLPVGLIAGSAVEKMNELEKLKDPLLIGVDLGPNLSVTGSLATILWLIALRREGEEVRGWDFFKLGLVVTPLALFVAVLCRS